MFSFEIQAFVFLLLMSLCSSEHGGAAPLRSGVAEADDGVLVRGGTSLRRASTILKFPRVLKKKRKKQKVPKVAKSKKEKVPKAAKSKKEKVPKAAKSKKTNAPTPGSTNAVTTPQPSSSPQPTEACAAITNQKDALLALKEGFANDIGWDINTDPCTGLWTGITCDSDGKVTRSINLCK